MPQFSINLDTCIIISKWCLQAVENVWLKYITKFCHLVTALVEKWRTKLSNPSITCIESAEKQMLDKSIISVARVAKNMESWFKDICNYSRGYRIKWQKSLKRSRVFPAKRVEREEVINNRFIHELKLTFLLNFLHLSEEIDTEKSLERAATPATLKKIEEKHIRFWCIVSQTYCSNVNTLQSTADILTLYRLPSFLSISNNCWRLFSTILPLSIQRKTRYTNLLYCHDFESNLVLISTIKFFKGNKIAICSLWIFFKSLFRPIAREITKLLINNSHEKRITEIQNGQYIPIYIYSCVKSHSL